jgi:hypothetical protein
MSLYAIRNDEGLLMDDLGQFEHDRDVCAFHSKSDAKDWADNKRGHVVELTKKPAPIVVSAEEAEMLEQAKDDYCAASVISAYSKEHIGAMGQDRLMRAYVNGYTVAKDKKYNVKVPLVQAQGGLWFYINSEDKLGATYLPKMAKKFTIEEIEHYGLQDCDKVEVEENGGLDK